MAIKTSKKATDSTVKDFKLYTGVIPYHVVAVNPTLEQLKEMGIEYLQNEPKYVTETKFDDGNVVKSTIVDLWIQSLPMEEFPDLDVLTNIRFRINHEPWVGRSGKKKFINKYGRTAWADDVAGLDSNKYYINEGTRPCHSKEEELHKFLFSWLNMVYDSRTKEYDECLIDISKIIKGDVSELANIIKGSDEYTVKALTGINAVEKEGKMKYYVSVYDQMFLKHNQTATNRLQEYVEKDEYTEFKATSGEMYFTYDIKEFDRNAPTPDEDTPEEEEENVF